MSKRHETLDTAKEEAIKYGATFEYTNGKKRYIGIVKFNNKCRKIAISHEANCPRVLMNIKENVRTAIREMSN